jgi:outer membrane protein TolC
MKNRIFYILLLLSVKAFPQNRMVDYLNRVEANNKQLIAARELLKSSKLEARTNLLPENPVVEYGYFPGKGTMSGNKTIYGISQELEFPSVYFLKKKIANVREQHFNLEYFQLRQEILLEAQSLFYEYIYFNRYEMELKKRLINAEKLYKSYADKFDQGNVSVLDVNKSKILYLASKSKYEMATQELEKVQNMMKMMNGGLPFEMNDNYYPFINITLLDSIKNQLQETSPVLKTLESEIQISKLNTNLSKQYWLPSFEIGYESEAEPDGTYAGLRAGLALPLWRNKNTVKTANAMSFYSETVYEHYKQQLISELENTYNKAIKYKLLLDDYDELLQTETDLAFIEKALNLGQISILEYVNELSLYYEIIDLRLLTEKEYYISLANIYKYSL